jgi:flagellin FlaA/flagellin FlaB
MREHTRRQVLGTLGIGGIGGLAGCLRLDSGATEETETTTTTTTTEDDSTAETTEETSAEVSNRVNVIDAVGHVSNRTVTRVEISVMRAVGSDSINISRSTLQWIGPDTAATLTYTDGEVPPADSDAEQFATENIRGAPDNMTLDTDDDRLKLLINPASVAEPLEPGAEVQLTFTTQYGSQTQLIIHVPDSLEGKKAVAL